MCIYLTSKEKLSYKNAEHIISAGLGGKLKLPLGYVSDEFNNIISKCEQEFLRSSIISLPRQISGPGKRGSLNPKKETKSKISVFSEPTNGESFSLGYIQMSKPFEIPHVIFNQITGEVIFNFPKENSEDELKNFSENISKAKNLKTRFIKFEALEKHKFILGIKSGIEENYSCFIASYDGKTNPFTQTLVNEISNTLNNSINPLLISSQVRTHQSAKVDSNYYRCCAKIAFNFLAFCSGKDFVLNSKFNTLRDWIVNGGKNEFVYILHPNKTSTLKFPEDSHQIRIFVVDGNLVANITFYDKFNNLVILCRNFNKKFKIKGLICDWKNEKEYELYEYIAQSIKDTAPR
ncbi:hypothetical protein [Flavobacterium soyae]|uniref:hypothetical protein n=1 Tax=Flavobacterium soyae TaxID=2903098 RepID=UPI001E448397|nr:hypothetical protein [Flavobacterium soyae]MCD9576791.1 hypothetical protein [Flavobacterium soyae]